MRFFSFALKTPLTDDPTWPISSDFDRCICFVFFPRFRTVDAIRPTPAIRNRTPSKHMCALALPLTFVRWPAATRLRASRSGGSDRRALRARSYRPSRCRRTFEKTIYTRSRSDTDRDLFIAPKCSVVRIVRNDENRYHSRYVHAFPTYEIQLSAVVRS